MATKWQGSKAKIFEKEGICGQPTEKNPRLPTYVTALILLLYGILTPFPFQVSKACLHNVATFELYCEQIVE